jgi:hypothetical protein
MVHQQGYLAAADGKHPDSKASATSAFIFVRRLLIAAAVFCASFYTSDIHAQGPFGGMAGTWHGGGTVTLEDGSTERIRCRAVYAVAGATMNMTLTCASDAYKFNLSANVVDQGGTITGTWSEASRNINGSLQGRGAGGSFQVVASAGSFNSSISLATRGNRQSVSMRADSQFRSASITMTR